MCAARRTTGCAGVPHTRRPCGRRSLPSAPTRASTRDPASPAKIRATETCRRLISVGPKIVLPQSGALSAFCSCRRFRRRSSQPRVGVVLLPPGCPRGADCSRHADRIRFPLLRHAKIWVMPRTVIMTAQLAPNRAREYGTERMLFVRRDNFARVAAAMGCRRFVARPLVAALISPRVGASIERYGGRPVLALSAVAIGVGQVGLALAPTLATCIASWLVIGVGMGAGLYDAAFGTLGRLYGHDARSAITTLTLFGGVRKHGVLAALSLHGG